MARKVVWSNEAVADLESLAEYISRDSSFYAASFVREILSAGRSLSKYAERGRAVPELTNPDIREILVREYRLVYIIEKFRIVILGIIHGKRNLKTLWEKEQRDN
ncbi:MAG: type II toxin-antitoxin system RelE/ParE family toxin [Proteobacteria bacterium]|nr:type II toxin-antitoxin system RelE/ParE family toxin [Pseudomonadota bacterium]